MNNTTFLLDGYDEYGVMGCIEQYLSITYNHEFASLSEISLDLILISEVFEYFSNKEVWLNYIYRKLESAKKLISTFYHETRLYGGLLEFAVALKLIHNSTGYFAKPLGTINKALTQSINEKINNYIQNISSLTISDYDLIAGATGIGIYLLYMDKYFDSSMSQLNIYFSKLCSSIDEKYGWFIKYENQLKTNEEMQKYKLGHYDCGAAHGIAGPLFVLSKICKNNISNCTAIEHILNFYASIEYKVNDVFTWPGKVPPFQEIPTPYVNFSWCYGYTGIYNSIFSAYTALGYEKQKNRLLENSIKLWQKMVVSQSMTYLRSYGLCHGYAGVLCGMTRTFNLTNEKDLIQNIFLLRRFIISNLQKINNNVSLLEGMQGVLLALLHSIKNNTKFDLLLLLK